MQGTLGRQLFYLAGWLCLLISEPLLANEKDDGFATCIDGLKQRAQTEGINSELVALLDTIEPIERVIQLDRNQPEYTQTFAEYLNRRVTDNQIDRGRRLLENHRPLLEQLTKDYGIPPQYIVAFWGLETSFGRILGKMPILDSLATLACDQRRSELFTRELLIALTLVGEHALELESFQGSWAGAMGHTQFMPSVYERYGIDADQDGRVDLWGSIPDALTSAANYLQQIGWQRELRWGREVQVPVDFDYYQSGINKPLSLMEWRQLNVKRSNGSNLVGDDTIVAALLVPAGREGPKFLVYENFQVILNWNTPMFYGLSVGHMADRINGAGKLYQPPPTARGLVREQVEAVQRGLNQLGFDSGNPDGKPGPATQSAAQDFQRSIQVTADGYVDAELYQQVQDQLKAKPN